MSQSWSERATGQQEPQSRLIARGDGWMSKYHFLRIFRRITGHTPQQFILAQRMSRAATDLALQRKSITATILDNGFNDISTFNARFRRIFGEAPGSYRARTNRFAADDPFHADAGAQPGAVRTGQKRRERQC